MMLAALKAADRAVAVTCKYVAIACFLALFALLGAAIVLRLVPIMTIQGYDEIVELLFIWIVMLTSFALWREGALYRVVVIEDALPPWLRKPLEILINLAMLGFALILVFYGWDFVAMSGETTPFLRLDRSYWYAAIPICGSLMVLYSLVWLWRVIRGGDALETRPSLLN